MDIQVVLSTTGAYERWHIRCTLANVVASRIDLKNCIIFFFFIDGCDRIG